MKRILLVLSAAFILFTQLAIGQTHVNGYYRKDGTYVHSYTRSSSSTSHSTSTYSLPTTTHHSSSSSATVSRDAHGRIKRSSSAKHEFEVQSGYPHGRPGYVVDHIIPLANGGCDCPSNMQWQTIEEAKEKDKWERK